MDALTEALRVSPERARVAFIEVLCWLVHADGAVDPREVTFVQSQALALGVPQVELHEPMVWDDRWPEQLEDIGHHVLMQCALLTVADGSCHVRERERLEFLEGELDAQPGSVDEMVEWALEGHRWMSNGARFLRRDG